MAMFKEVADIKTADMLNLPIPEVEYHNIAVKPSQVQKEMVASLGERAEKIRGGNVDSSVDNMLKVTNDGRKLALDQRMMNPMLPDEEGSKVNACVNEVFRIWEENSDKKLTQLLFCDLSTPKGAGEFSVYTDIRQKLIERGIPESEIKFIHEADTEAKKQELFKKVRCGEVRILMGSTQKMGAGTNVQNKIIASHDLDCPCRSGTASRKNGAAGQRKSKGRFVPICYGRHFRRILLAARRGQAEVRKSDYDEQIARAFLRRCGRYRPFLCGDQNACGRQSAH